MLDNVNVLIYYLGTARGRTSKEIRKMTFKLEGLELVQHTSDVLSEMVGAKVNYYVQAFNNVYFLETYINDKLLEVRKFSEEEYIEDFMNEIIERIMKERGCH